ncbi:MAG: hypothetical protein L0216_03565 [Planctomycetales bacterium]|nr:hypothetical protein [Planctomycetales bacterium]
MRAIFTSLGLALALPASAASPVPPQDFPEGVEFGEPLVDPELGVEIRLPTGGQREKVNPSVKHEFRYRDAAGWEGLIRLSGSDRGLPYDDFVDGTSSAVEMGGFTVVEQSKLPDAETGSAGCVRLRRPADKVATSLHFYRRTGWACCVAFTHSEESADLWRRIAAAVLRTVRVTWLPEGWARPPEPHDRLEGESLNLLAARGIPPSASKAIREDFAAGVGLARELTGGPAPSRPLTVHLFGDTARLKAIHEGAAVDLPAAIYLPEARLVVAHAAPGPNPSRNLGSRCEAAFLGYLDDWLGSLRGLPPWLEAGLREAARAARRSGAKAVPELKSSPHAKWIRENGRRPTGPGLAEFLEFGRARFEEGKPEVSATALALVLASRASPDEGRRMLVPRGLFHFRTHRQDEGARAAGLHCVDIPALEAEVRALLAKG